MTTTYDEYCEEQEAIWAGRATELVHCYLCFLEDAGTADMSPRADQGPLRGVLKRTCPPSPDPTEVLHLSCGHAII